MKGERREEKRKARETMGEGEMRTRKIGRDGVRDG